MLDQKRNLEIIKYFKEEVTPHAVQPDNVNETTIRVVPGVNHIQFCHGTKEFI